MTNTTMRVAGISVPRISETVTFVATRTVMVASPKANPFASVLVTASSGQSPSSCTNAGLFRHTPSKTTVFTSLIGCARCCSGAEEFLFVELEIEQRLANAVYDGAWRHGRAGQRVE